MKAIIEQHGDRVPKIHSLSKLFDLCSAYFDYNANEDLIIALDSLYIESRYPGELGLLPMGKPTIQQAEQFNTFAKEVYQNTIKLLKSY